MTLAIVVLSLTRDRLDYSKHCFASLHEHAGIPFDHYVLDQGSEDGTAEWLHDYDPFGFVASPENVGINRGLNTLLSHAAEMDDYDVIVKFDNDCELTQPNTLRDVCALADEGGCILSPRIMGLRNPPRPLRELTIGAETILDVPQIGSIFMAVPAWMYGEFQYDESKMIYDDVDICSWWRQRGGTCGYVKRLEAWHYETTDGQHERYPEYFERRVARDARMSLIIANTSFAYKNDVYQHGGTYDTAVAAVNAANVAVPHLFYASAGTKTITGTFAMRDTRAGGIDRIVHIGEQLPSGDTAVTAAGTKLSK